MSLGAFARTFAPPESDTTVRLADMLLSSAWRCRHRTEMIRWRRHTEGWNG
ncbi:MAG: hypothetical protein Q9O74_06180 [Planctomycetota bacterium]|nr:hypothetical protein [Planctomycetota bacterium]